MHADAALGDLAADQPGRVGAVDAIERVAEIERANAQRVAGIAARDMGRQLRILAAHLGRWRPTRIDLLGADAQHARPAGFTLRDCDRIADRTALGLHIVETAVAEADDDLARPVAAREADLGPAIDAAAVTPAAEEREIATGR